jgi:hypothetical protein
MSGTRCFCHIAMKLGFSQQIFVKYLNVKFYEILPSASRIIPLG